MAIVTVAKMTVPKLQQRHAELFGEESRTPHRQYLFGKIAWELQAREEGRLPEEVWQYAFSIAREAKLGARMRTTRRDTNTGCSFEAHTLRRESHQFRDAKPSGEKNMHHGSITRTATTPVTPTHDSRIPMPGSLTVREFKNRSIVMISQSMHPKL